MSGWDTATWIIVIGAAVPILGVVGAVLKRLLGYIRASREKRREREKNDWAALEATVNDRVTACLNGWERKMQEHYDEARNALISFREATLDLKQVLKEGSTLLNDLRKVEDRLTGIESGLRTLRERVGKLEPFDDREELEFALFDMHWRPRARDACLEQEPDKSRTAEHTQELVALCRRLVITATQQGLSGIDSVDDLIKDFALARNLAGQHDELVRQKLSRELMTHCVTKLSNDVCHFAALEADQVLRREVERRLSLYAGTYMIERYWRSQPGNQE